MDYVSLHSDEVSVLDSYEVRVLDFTSRKPTFQTKVHIP